MKTAHVHLLESSTAEIFQPTGKTWSVFLQGIGFSLSKACGV
jgi:hypothetical protein